MKIKYFNAAFLLLGMVSAGNAQVDQHKDCPYTYNVSSEFAINGKSPTGFPPYLEYVLDYKKEGKLAIYGGWTEPHFTFVVFSNDFTVMESYVPSLGSKTDKTSLFFYDKLDKRYCNVIDESTTNNTANVYDFSSIKSDFNSALLKTITKPHENAKIMRRSDNNSKVLFRYNLIDESKKKLIDPEIGIIVTDESWKTLYKKEIKLPGYRKRPGYNRGGYLNNNFIHVNSSITNSGKVIIQYEKFYDDDVKTIVKEGKTNFCYSILIIDKENENPRDIKIDLENYFVDYTVAPKFIEDINGNSSIAFMCNKNASFEKVVGFKGNGTSMLCFIDLEKTNDKIYRISENVIEIPVEILKKYNPKAAGSDPKISGYIDLEALIVMPDGGIKIICEEKNAMWGDTYGSLVGRHTPFDLTYSVNTISFEEAGCAYIYSLNADKKLEWITKIPRRIHSLAFNGIDKNYNNIDSGFNYFIKDGYLDILYTGNKLNLNSPIDLAPKGSKEEEDKCLLVTRIDKKGQQQTYLLKEKIKDEELPEPGSLTRENNILYSDIDPYYYSGRLKSNKVHAIVYISPR